MSAILRRWPAVVAAALAAFAAVAVALAAHGWGPFGFERAAIDWSAHHRPPGARRVAIGVTVLGTGVAPYLVSLIAGLVLARRRAAARPRRARVALLLAPVLWLACGQLLRDALMHGFGRPRPPVARWATSAAGFSFPSGHSFTSAVCAGLLVVAVARRRPSWTPITSATAVLYAVAVGLSRVYLGVHWPLDVLGSWLLAAGWLAAGFALLGRVDPLGPVGPGSGDAAGTDGEGRAGDVKSEGAGESSGPRGGA
ncbi:phosphatase PAP2 family protein [Actinacidiphila rubida]|uniref:Undecaprenyl-diphosphatase n=1 Tax=Actinacidiphila rubida TaxID=310780 RepID=A0A1H8K605_9ACTN|nr:phosphatase PAP2 family protein [Actinacidiphila rubida]SEN88479.1 undecaprenyl-diphosphatase [Actinacidiphila rubida]